MTADAIPAIGEREFRIELSAPTARTALIPADVATCDDCLRELFDPADRRYRYPFVNCTQCGPRFTIVVGVPYDRPLTTMAGFPLCAECRREYEDPGDRRFHAEPIACPVCGPTLRLSSPSNTVLLGEEALGLAVGRLRDGAILAVKGLGGYHLACDAANEEAVARLRARKHREDKPFAVMTSAPTELASVVRRGARPAALARAPDRAPAPAHGHSCRAFGRARHRVARDHAAVHAAPSPARTPTSTGRS